MAAKKTDEQKAADKAAKEAAKLQQTAPVKQSGKYTKKNAFRRVEK